MSEGKRFVIISTMTITDEESEMETKAAIEWLNEGARYFEKLDTGGEDRTFWSNVYNAENARKIRDRLVAAERMAEALRGIADRHEGVCCDVKQWTVDKCDNALKQWENLK